MYEQANLVNDLNSIVQQIPDVLFRVDRDLNVLWMNEAATQLLSHEQRNLYRGTPFPCYLLWFASQDSYDFQAINKAFATGKQQEEVFDDERKRTWGMKVFPPIETERFATAVTVMVSDITTKFMSRAEALRIGQITMLGQLAAGVAHEINNPINVIVNYAQLIADRCAPESEELQMSEEILREGARVASITSNLLAFASDQRDRKVFISPRTILHSVLMLVDCQLQQDGIVLETDIPADLPVVLAQKVQLQQMFLNLISNARYALNQKYPGRSVDKKLVICVKADDNAGQSVVRFNFLDYGTGIGKEHLDKIFDPFYTTKPPEQGTGLGLSVSHGIVKSHGGQIRIASEYGKYTEVTVDLPIQSIQLGGEADK